MGKRLCVGNLPYQTSQGELEDLFAQVGPVAEATIIYDRYTDVSKGFGFVEMVDEEAANAAMERLDGTELGRRTINVAEAQPRRRSQPRDDRYYSNW